MDYQKLSREDFASRLGDEEERLQYDSSDPDRVKAAATVMTQAVVELIESLGEYAKELETETDEDSASRIGYARRDVIEKWAASQIGLSKVAHVFRFIGEEAFMRMIAALSIEDGNIDMSGL